jgi:hypothetical protein
MKTSKGDGIYVEIQIHAPLEAVWRHTQTPELHEKWDLRFSSITYLPDTVPQRFLYETRLGFGLTIAGEGETVQSTGEEVRSSSLKFWSADWKSLIEEGSGYWRYVPVEGGVRFITWYDYRTRFGLVGKAVDRLVFRPLMAWATAWSFDRLRIWLEEGTPPDVSLLIALGHSVARISVALVWIWHGLVPKILVPSADEYRMAEAAGMKAEWVPWVGVAEILLGLITLATWRWRDYFIWNMVAMFAALGVVAVTARPYLFGAFNPVTLNVMVVMLSLIGFLAGKYRPTAGHCLRRAPR